jgi:hypothetical protein
MNAELMRLALSFCVVGMALLASFYLSKRKLSVFELLGWGVLVLLLPLLGPFLAILARPGIKT